MEWKRGGPERGPLFVPAGTKRGPLQDKGEGRGSKGEERGPGRGAQDLGEERRTWARSEERGARSEERGCRFRSLRRAPSRGRWGPGANPAPLAHPPGVGGKARGAPPSHKRRYRTGGCGGLRHLWGLCPRSAHASLPRKPPDPITGLMAPPALASHGVDIWVSAIWSGASPLSAPGHVAPWFCPRRAW